jgi:hypothetical protein
LTFGRTRLAGSFRNCNCAAFMKTGLSVRPAAVSDSEFIGALASTILGYTVPPPYVLWMFERFHKGWCAVVRGDGNPLGYILAFPVNRRAVFVWQLACTKEGERLHASDALAGYIRRLMVKGGYRQIVFTNVPQSVAERAVRLIARRIFKVSIRKKSRLPKLISRQEWEYVLDTPAVSRKGRNL